MIKSLWASVIENPVRFKQINGWLVLVWTCLVPISYTLGWLQSVTYVSALSLYALITGHLSTWQAARVEVRQEADEERKDDEFEARVEEKINQVLKRLPQ